MRRICQEKIVVQTNLLCISPFGKYDFGILLHQNHFLGIDKFVSNV